MSQWYCSVCHEVSRGEKKPSECSKCHSDDRLIMALDEVPETVEQVRDIARKKLKGICAVYPSCDGTPDKICQREAYGKPIGLGGAGKGNAFRNNVQALDNIKFNMSVVGDHFEPDTACSFLGIPLDFPVLASSTAGIEKYNDALDETDFCVSVLQGAKEAGTIGLRGDTWFYTADNHPSLDAMKAVNGFGIPIFKPRAQTVLKKLIKKAEKLDCRAVGVDLDGCGSANMAKHNQKVFKKSTKDIRDLVNATSLPFIAKGIMRPDEALKCADAGVSAISVSNHGGRVLDATPGVAEVLPLIRKEVGDAVIITADGGVRTGYDVLKLLALGADAVLVGRDIIRAAVGAGSLGVRMHFQHVQKTLKKAMFMTGVKTIGGADASILF